MSLKNRAKSTSTQPEDDLVAGIEEELIVQKELKEEAFHETPKGGDNELLSLLPAGLPILRKSEVEFKLLYDWKQAMGRERNLRSPSIKPQASNADAEILAVFRRKSAAFAWDHLQLPQRQSTVEDIEISNTIKDTKPKRLITKRISEHQLIQTDSHSFHPDLFHPPRRKPGHDSSGSPTEKRRVPRPPWRDNSQVFDPLDSPVSKQSSEEYWTLDRRDNPCFQPLPMLDLCKTLTRKKSTGRYRRAKPINLDDQAEFDRPLQKLDIGRGHKCCSHPCFTVVPGKIRRSLPWAPCAPIPRTLLLCENCGAAFCGKPERRHGRFVALVEFCGYAVIDEEGLIQFHLNNPKAEAVPVQSEPPKRVKCSCQRCRRKRRKYGDHYPDCECDLCKRRSLKCLNRNYYAWLEKYYRAKSEDEQEKNRDPSEPIEPLETLKPFDEDDVAKECDCPECRRRRRNPGDHFKDCECQFCEDRKTKCMRFVLNADSTDNEDESKLSAKARTPLATDDSADSDDQLKTKLKNLATISKDSLDRAEPLEKKSVEAVNWSEFMIETDVESNEDDKKEVVEPETVQPTVKSVKYKDAEKVEVKPKPEVSDEKKPDPPEPDDPALQIDQLLQNSISSLESKDSKSSIENLKKTDKRKQ